jgi:O-antigen biosynthesis protein
LWAPLLWMWPVFFGAIAVVVIQATISAYKNASLPPHKKNNINYRLLIIALHIIQPIARLSGRIKHGLTPWRRRGAGITREALFTLRSKTFLHWSEEWRSMEDWLTEIEKNLIHLKSRIKRGAILIIGTSK